MGLLTEGSPLSWEETKKHAQHVREHGILQFINQYNKLKDRSNDCLRWGDEVEYMLTRFDHEAKTARLLLKAPPLLKQLQLQETTSPNNHPTTWRPEYAAYMIEGTPGKPYGHRMAHFNNVEHNMKYRREEVVRLLSGPDETALTLTSFPRLGCPNFSEPPLKPDPQGEISRSLFIPDGVIFLDHPRFQTLTRNIRERRGEKVAINVPIFKDTETPSPFREDLTQYGDTGEGMGASMDDHVYLDAMAFGMGACCLQVTFQACNITEARLLYDQLAPLCPILLALSAACPVQRGYLTDGDCRWNIIAASVDDRTKEERGLEPLKENRFVIPKSRYDSIDSYLSPCSEPFNDIDLVYDKDVYQQLTDAGIDHLLAQHMAHLFIRDPISLFSERVNQDDMNDTDHFENIQSTNWQSMRFKPPPPGSSIGWRVEFRPTEVQLTDFENAAYVVFVVLLTRAILSFKLNFVMPISKVDENMKAAQKRDAVLNEKFFFRRNITTCHTPKTCSETICCVSNQDCFPQMTINEIINGKSGEFPGLVPLIYQFLHSVDDLDVDTSCTISQYLHLIQERASGRLMTTARWMRDFITKHPEYKHDSVVTETINYDFVNECHQVLNGKPCPELLIQHQTKTNDTIPLAMKKHEQALIGLSEMSKSCDSSEDSKTKWQDQHADDRFESIVEELSSNEQGELEVEGVNSS